MSNFGFGVTSTCGVRKPCAVLPVMVLFVALMLAGCASNKWGAVACSNRNCAMAVDRQSRDDAKEIAMGGCKKENEILSVCYDKGAYSTRCIGVSGRFHLGAADDNGLWEDSWAEGGSKLEEAALNAVKKCMAAGDRERCGIIDLQCR